MHETQMSTTHDPIRILFVCHGNICRSTMAEFVMKDLARKAGLENSLVIASAATSAEEIGNDTHPGTKRVLDKHEIPYQLRAARQLRGEDEVNWDYIIGMDSANMRNIARMLPHAHEHAMVTKLASFAGHDHDIADPWYTGDFNTTYADVTAGCQGLLREIQTKYIGYAE